MNKVRKMLFSIAVVLCLVSLGTIGTIQKIFASSAVSRSCEPGAFCWSFNVNDDGELVSSSGFCFDGGQGRCACLLNFGNLKNGAWQEGCS